MKNFKLLLATTAILSTGLVMRSSYATYQNQHNVANFSVDVEFVAPTYINNLGDMKIGKIGVHTTGSSAQPVSVEGSLKINTDGTVTPSNLDYFGGAQMAKVNYSGSMDNRHLSFDKKVELTSDSITGEDKVCGTLENIEASDWISGSGYYYANIGGTFYVPSKASLGNFKGSCTGNFTATVLINSD